MYFRIGSRGEDRRESEKMSESRERLLVNIHDAKLKVFGRTLQDGNCFFHAICIQLERLNVMEISHLQLRENVVDFIRDNTILRVMTINVKSLSSKQISYAIK